MSKMKSPNGNSCWSKMTAKCLGKYNTKVSTVTVVSEEEEEEDRRDFVQDSLHQVTNCPLFSKPTMRN